MKEKLKELYESYKELPEIFLFSVVLLKTFFQKSDLVYRKRTKETINILGNGPSGHVTYLKNKDSKEKLLCVNYFALTKEFLVYKPEYYALIDPEFFLNLNEKNLKLMEALNNVDWNIKLLVPSKYKGIVSEVVLNEHVELNYVRFNYLPGRNRLVYGLYLKNLATPKFQNVIVACIYMSLNYGFSKIKLHGVEANEFRNFTVNERNEVLLETMHSYGNSTINMFENGRIKKGEFWKYLNYYSYMLKGFSQVEKYSKYIGSEIYNFTKDSYIDSFEKK